jgi:hypothetical protein
MIRRWILDRGVERAVLPVLLAQQFSRDMFRIVVGVGLSVNSRPSMSRTRRVPSAVVVHVPSIIVPALCKNFIIVGNAQHRIFGLRFGYLIRATTSFFCTLTPVPRVVKEGPRFHFLAPATKVAGCENTSDQTRRDVSSARLFRCRHCRLHRRRCGHSTEADHGQPCHFDVLAHPGTQSRAAIVAN